MSISNAGLVFVKQLYTHFQCDFSVAYVAKFAIILTHLHILPEAEHS